jgi:hypothetical protein
MNMPNIKPIPERDTPAMIDQAHMVVPNTAEAIGEQEEDARQGGRISTEAYNEEETRPQELHGAVQYQKETADPGQVPKFYPYVDLTANKGTVRG